MRRRLAIIALTCAAGLGAAACGPSVPGADPPGPTIYLYAEGSPRADYWLAMGRCEQPGNGYGGVRWDVHGPTYEGGLGFAWSTWNQYRLEEMPENGGDASVAEQMIVADRVYDDVGAGAWGCSARVGLRP